MEIKVVVSNCHEHEHSGKYEDAERKTLTNLKQLPGLIQNEMSASGQMQG